MPNRLANELSPYLLQHAGNPVDWQPWGADGALRCTRAAEADLPVDRLFRLPLVPRDGPRELRGPRDRPAAERAFRQHQGGSPGAARPGPDLHGGGADDDRPRRLADVGVPDAGGASRSSAARTGRRGRGAGCPASIRSCRPWPTPGSTAATSCSDMPTRSPDCCEQDRSQGA